MNDIQAIRDALAVAQDQAYASDRALIDSQQLLGDQAITYANEARGTLYSGMPTFQRAELATKTLQDVAKLNSNYADSRVRLWNNIQNAMDQIAATQEAISFYDSDQMTAPQSSRTATTNAMAMYPEGYRVTANGKIYEYINGRFQEVAQ